MEAHAIPIQETVPASRKLGRSEALELLQSAQQVIAAKGKKVTVLDLQNTTPSDAQIASLLLGPTGNLRAPLLRVGKTILVGYNEQAFAEIFG